jgi:Protein of unknown function (DUF2778)
VRSAQLDVEPLGRDRDGAVLARPVPRLISAGIAALAIGFSLGLRAIPPGISVSETIQPRNFDPGGALRSQIPVSRGLRVASLETEATFASATGRGDRRVSPAEEPAIDWGAASFDERFAGRVDWPGSRQSAEAEERANRILQPSPDLGGHAPARRAVAEAAPGSMPLPPLPPASVAKKRLRIAEATTPEDGSPPGADGQTAIYDIVAQRVYLPNGQRLEAHSGMGSYLDDPRYVSEKDRGPTPPNVYDLSLREESFHGVRAIRLIPVGSGNMFGREGMLAHSYMLGPNGQSNGCVSLSDYPTFLNAFLSGQINRLVVVEHLATAPSSRTAWGWLPESIKSLFWRS